MIAPRQYECNNAQTVPCFYFVFLFLCLVPALREFIYNRAAFSTNPVQCTQPACKTNQPTLNFCVGCLDALPSTSREPKQRCILKKLYFTVNYVDYSLYD